MLVHFLLLALSSVVVHLPVVELFVALVHSREMELSHTLVRS
jgi:hypothetical protein